MTHDLEGRAPEVATGAQSSVTALQALRQLDDMVTSEQVHGESWGTGLQPLDTHLGGGLHAGDLVMLAGPQGTGKTTVLVERFAHLVAAGAAPESLLVLCFSTPAADTMRERLEDRLEQAYEELPVTTFHGFCARLLREHAAEVDDEGAALLGRAQQVRWRSSSGEAFRAELERWSDDVTRTLADLEEAATAVERHADEVAIRLTGDPGAFAAAQQTLLLTNLADPSPPAAVQWWFGTHPTGAERVAVALGG